ncbi:MAG: hypothetical protein OK436_02855 [Thaumarchaeota archaeon]|nr:hypothetical protein [Nitrososphaerota archaeon]
MAKKKQPAQLAENVNELQGGYVPVEKDGKTQWVDPSTLSKSQQSDVSEQATQVTGAQLPPALREDIKNEGTAEKTANPTESAYQQLADAQANQYLQMTKSLDPLTSGAALPAIEGTAAANASQMLGQSATSPVSQWLNQQTQAAQAQNAPAQAANAQVGVAQDYASTLLASGLQNMGKAENEMMQAAPYQQLLQSLAQDVPYKLLGGTETIPQIMQNAKSAESQLGLSTSGLPNVPTPQLPSLGLNAGVAPNPGLTQFQPNPAPQG